MNIIELIDFDELSKDPNTYNLITKAPYKQTEADLCDGSLLYVLGGDPIVELSGNYTLIDYVNMLPNGIWWNYINNYYDYDISDDGNLAVNVIIKLGSDEVYGVQTDAFNEFDQFFNDFKDKPREFVQLLML